MLSRFSWDSLVLLGLILFSIINPYTSGDVLVFLIISFAIIYKIFGEYTLLLLLGIRPAMDYWRDYDIFSYNTFHFNFNAGFSLLLLGWAVYFFWANREYWKKIPSKWPWLLFIAWCSLTLTYSYDPASTIIETLKAANFFSLFGITHILKLKDNTNFSKNLYLTLIAAAVIPLLMALNQFITHTGMSIDGFTNRIYGTFAHPNNLATFTLLLFMVWFQKIMVEKNKFWRENPGLGKLIGAFLAVIIFLTYTRIAWIGFALFLLTAGWVYYRRFTIGLITGVALFYLIFYPVNAFLVENANINLQSIDIIARLTTRNREADSISWRADVFNKVLPLYRARPILGYGYGSFAQVWDDSKGVENLWDNTSEAHNDYLKVGFEGGAVGLVLYLSIFASLIFRQIRIGLKHNWKNLVYLASIFVYLILSASDNMLHHTPVIWWLWALWGMWEAETTEL